MRISKQNIKLALISLQKDTQRAPPIGLVYLATYLRDRVGIPAPNIKVFDNYFSKNIEAELLRFQPDLVGFSAMSVNYGDTVAFAGKLRKVLRIPFIIGGVHISTLPESLEHVFNLGVIGEGEITTQELVELLCEKGEFNPEHLKSIKSIVFRPEKDTAPYQTERREAIKNLDDLPFPDFHFVHPGFFIPEEIPPAADIGVKAYVLSSRGCPYKCPFCSTARFWGKMRFHSPDYTARLIKHMVDNQHADYLWTLDDLFTVNPKRIREIREALVRHGVFDKIKGTVCNVRVNTVNDELCKELVKIKTIMCNFGFESGSDRILKQLKPGTSLEHNRKAILTLKKHNLTVYGSLMYGVPGETIEDIQKTNDFIDFAIANGAKYIWSFVAAPYPGTPFWDIALQRGKINVHMDWSKLGCHTPEDALLLDDTVEKNEFVRMFNIGRKKLRKMKIRLIINFVRENYVLAFRMLLREPAHYFRSALTWVIEQ